MSESNFRIPANPFDKIKEPQRYQDWQDGYATGFACKITIEPNIGDALAGFTVASLLDYVNPHIRKSLKHHGIRIGEGMKINRR